MGNATYVEVKTGVNIRHISKFRQWASLKWPVIDYGKYGRFPNQYITMIFPRYLGEDITARLLNGEFDEKTIKEKFKNAYPY